MGIASASVVLVLTRLEECFLKNRFATIRNAESNLKQKIVLPIVIIRTGKSENVQKKIRSSEYLTAVPPMRAETSFPFSTYHSSRSFEGRIISMPCSSQIFFFPSRGWSKCWTTPQNADAAEPVAASSNPSGRNIRTWNAL